DYFKPLGVGSVVRYELPNLGALNFILPGILGRGGSDSLRIDAQGKALGQALLELEIEAPEAVTEGLRTALQPFKIQRRDADATQTAQHVAKVLKSVARSRLVTIAAVHGSAMAGGAGLMTACDLVVATNDCKIGYPEVLRGLVAGLVMRFLCNQVGQRRAREL